MKKTLVYILFISTMPSIIINGTNEQPKTITDLAQKSPQTAQPESAALPTQPLTVLVNKAELEKFLQEQKKLKYTIDHQQSTIEQLQARNQLLVKEKNENPFSKALKIGAIVGLNACYGYNLVSAINFTINFFRVTPEQKTLLEHIATLKQTVDKIQEFIIHQNTTIVSIHETLKTSENANLVNTIYEKYHMLFEQYLTNSQQYQTNNNVQSSTKWKIVGIAYYAFQIIILPKLINVANQAIQ